MKVYFLDTKPPLNGADLDPRRRCLYGSDVIWIGSEQSAVTLASKHGNGSIAIGDFFVKRKPWHVVPRIANDFAMKVAKFRHEHPDGVLIVGNHEMAEALLGSNISFVFDPTDSAALYHKRRALAIWRRHPVKALNSMRWHFYYRNLEEKIARRAALFLTTGPADEYYLRSLAPQGHIFRIGNGTPLVDDPPISPSDDGKTIGFHGGMTWEPNRMTAERLASFVAPMLAIKLQRNIRVRIAGRPVFSAIERCNGKCGVEILGFVEDLKSWMESLSLYVMPMYQGGGIKNKLIEALAAGLPVITNTLGAEAIPEEDRCILEVVDSDEELVVRICSLLDNPERLYEMRLKGREYALKNFKWEDRRNEFMSELNRLKKEGFL